MNFDDAVFVLIPSRICNTVVLNTDGLCRFKTYRARLTPTALTWWASAVLLIYVQRVSAMISPIWIFRPSFSAARSQPMTLFSKKRMTVEPRLKRPISAPFG